MKISNYRKVLIFITPILLFFSFLNPIKAETESYSGYWFVGIYAPENVTLDDNYYGDIVIVTDSENADGNITILSRSFHYNGTYTYYSHVPFGTSNPVGMHDYYRTGTFTGTATYTLQDVSLNATQLQDILDAIDDVDTTNESILSYLPTIKNDIESKLNDLISTVNNIDNLIDTITWKDDPYFQFLGYSTSIDGTLTNSINSNTKTIYFHFFYGGSSDGANSNLKKIRTNVTTSITGAGDNDQPSLKLYYFNGTDYVLRSNAELWCRRDLYGRCTIYSTYSFYTNSERHFVIEFTWPRTSGRASLSNALDCTYIGINDIEYWQLLAYFETHAYYEKEYPDLDTTNDELNPVVDDMVNSEDNLISDFDSSISNPNVKPSTNLSSDTSGWGSGFTSSIGFVGYVYNQLLQSAQGGNPIYMLTNFSLMLGLALLIIGKRG